MTGFAKQSSATNEDWIASSQVLLAMTLKLFRRAEYCDPERVFCLLRFCLVRRMLLATNQES
jgi:hypothetical protein